MADFAGSEERQTGLSLDEVRTLSLAALIGAGTSPANAGPVAESVVAAEADGIRNIGLGYLPTYCAHVACGKVDGLAEPVITRPAPGAVLVDARTGFAHPAIAAGLAPLAQAARENGIAALAVTNSYSAGVLGHLIEPLAEEGLLALAFANAPANIAPWGGAKPLFGTNPLAVVVPRAGAGPLVIDQASSAVTKVAILERSAQGRDLRPGWALDKDGRPTVDPEAAMTGSMAPAGGHKGACIALWVEIMAAALTGASFSFQASSFGNNEGGPPRTGQFLMTIDPARFNPGFGQGIEDLAAAILAQEGTMLPGDERLAARKKAAAEGVRVPESLLNKIKACIGDGK